MDVKGGVSYDGSSWGTGARATFRATGNRPGYGVIEFNYDHDTTPTIIKGFDVDGGMNTISGIAMARDDKGNGLDGALKGIENCVVHDFSPSGMEYGISVAGEEGTPTKNIEILDCVVYNTPRTGIALYAGYSTPLDIHNVTVRGCEVYGTGTDPSAGGYGIMLKSHTEDVIVEYNYVHDTGGDGICIEGSPYNPHPTGPQNAHIRYNIINVAGFAGIYLHSVKDKSADIYGNLIFDNGKYGIHFESDLADDLDVNIYGNTIYNNGWGGIGIVSSSVNVLNLEIKDNIIIPKFGTSAISGATNEITSQSNNLLTNPGFKDSGNLPTGFIGTYGVDLRPNTEGLSLLEASDAIDAGIDLGEPYDKDIEGNTRTGLWDMGAYEYVSGEPPNCTSHSYSACYNGDVYWYDSCDNREGIKEDCGSMQCGSGECKAITPVNCSGLVLLMHLDSQERYDDSSGNGNNGSCSGDSCPSWNSSGRFDGAYEFDGQDDIIEIAGSSVQGHDLDMLENFTLSGWFKTYNLNTGNIISKRDGDDVQYQIFIYANKLHLRSGADVWDSDNEISLDTWYHVAAVFGASGTEPRLYVNGEQWSGNGQVLSPVHTETPVSIGARWNAYPATSFMLDGAIDEVSAWDRVLTDDDILSLYLSGTELSCSFHPADISEPFGCVTMDELTSFIELWLTSSDVSMSEVMEAVSLWRSGEGCS